MIQRETALEMPRGSSDSQTAFPLVGVRQGAHSGEPWASPVQPFSVTQGLENPLTPPQNTQRRAPSPERSNSEL